MIRNRRPSKQARAIFAVLMDHPSEWRHGYELSKFSGLSSGTLYPLLIRLHERQFLEARWLEPERPGRPPRHAYRLTAAGLAFARALPEEAAAAALAARERLA